MRPRAQIVALAVLLSLPAAAHAGDSCSASDAFGAPGMSASVHTLVLFDGELHAAGAFLTAGGAPATRIARWDGAAWSALGAGLDGVVYDLAVFDDGTGPALYAGGAFSNAGGAPAARIARWDGTSWSALGTGISGNWVVALGVFDDGTGDALFAGGEFSSAGGVSATNLAKWDGTSWSALQNALTGPVFALETFDDGGGAELYAGGFLSIFGNPKTEYIAKWNGTSWSELDPNSIGMNASVLALETFDDGTGEALFAGGYFQEAGGVPANFVARWDGTTWSALGSGMNAGVSAFTIFDDGGGPALFAGGRFTSAGGTGASRLARWDGSSWSAFGGGVDGCAPTVDCVEALAVHDDGNGTSLFAGGHFTSAGGHTSNRIARFSCAAVSVGGPIVPDHARIRSWPNPFRSHVTIGITGADVEGARAIEVFDAAGRRVAALDVGDGTGFVWNGRDAAGRALDAGVYYLRARRDGGSAVTRVVRLR